MTAFGSIEELCLVRYGNASNEIDMALRLCAEMLKNRDGGKFEKITGVDFRMDLVKIGWAWKSLTNLFNDYTWADGRRIGK